jgi:hypothetical protein
MMPWPSGCTALVAFLGRKICVRYVDDGQTVLLLNLIASDFVSWRIVSDEQACRPHVQLSIQFLYELACGHPCGAVVGVAHVEVSLSLK